MEDIFSLKDFRVYALKMNSQGELAQLLEVEQSNISRWEKNPDSIPWSVLRTICAKTGATLEELTGWRKPVTTALSMTNTWGPSIHQLPIWEKIKKFDQNQVNSPLMEAHLAGLKQCIFQTYQKPCVSLLGRSDSGKSTMENALFGVNRLPAAWTPTTAIPMYIKHISDKPIFMVDNVWIFKERIADQFWDVKQIYDQDYITTWRLASGDYELLKSYGSRQGEYYGEEAGAAVVFLDAPILQNCDMTDLPGFGTGADREDNATFRACQQTDICIYLSPANGFMQVSDCVYLKRGLMELPTYEGIPDAPLFNLFVVASQAHIINNGNPTQLQEILDYGCKNFLKTVPAVFWENRNAIWDDCYENIELETQLRKRFFPYTTSIPHVNQGFEHALKPAIEDLAKRKWEQYNNAIATYIYENFKNASLEYCSNLMLLNIETTSNFSLHSNRCTIKEKHLKMIQKHEEVRKHIEFAKKTSVDQCLQILSEFLTMENLENEMDEQGVSNERDSIHRFECNLQTAIVQKCQQIVEKNSNKIQEDMVAFITMHDPQINNPEHNLAFYEMMQMDTTCDRSESVESDPVLRNMGTKIYLQFHPDEFKKKARYEERKHLATIVGSTILSAFGPVGITLGSVMMLSSFTEKRLSGKWKAKCAKNILSMVERGNVIHMIVKSVEQYWDNLQGIFDAMIRMEDMAYAERMDYFKTASNKEERTRLSKHIKDVKQVCKMYNALALELGMRSDTEWFVQESD